MAGTWHGLIHQPSFNTSTMILLTDGRIMVQEEATPHWHALTPDIHGSYLHGTWSSLADMAIWRRYYASAVLKDGRVLVCGGEQSGGGGDTTNCQIYNPVTNTWSSVPAPPGWTVVGDASCVVLPNGKVMLGNLITTACAIYDPVTNSWSAAANKAVRSNEETWVLLPDNTVLTVQCFAPYSSEKYNIGTNTWKNEGSLPVTIVDPVMSEIGPAMLMYNKKVIYFGAANSSGHGKTAIYTMPVTAAGTGTWAAGPDIPHVGGHVMVANDCPATLLPNGKVLFTGAKFMNNDWGSPIFFFEYDPVSNTITQAATPANNSPQLFWSRMMLLPTGEVLFSPSLNNVQLYVPGGSPHNAWRPTISTVTPIGLTPHPVNFTLTGTQLNGFSQANMYGDDCYCSTNYPIVHLQNTVTNHVYFARTHGFSTMGVDTGATVESCNFNVSGIPDGNYSLTVIANGIGSHVHAFHKGPIKIVEKLHIVDKVYIIDNKQHIDVTKLQIENYGKLVAEGEILNQEIEVENQEILEVKTQLVELKNSIDELRSLITADKLPAVSADIGNKTTKDKKASVAETADKG
jgi:Kelch motif